MVLRVSLAVAALLLGPAQWTIAQPLPAVASVVAADAGSTDSPIGSAPQVDAAAPPSADSRSDVQPPTVAPASGVTFGAPTPRSPFTSIGHDLKRFFSKDTAVVMGFMAPIAGVALSWDNAGIEESQQHLHKSAFEPGNIGGSFLIQTGAAIATWGAGKVSGNRKTAEVGGDLIRAQFLSQLVVQGVKFTTRRERPDSSNNQSFPSGHTSSAFGTATVLERHFGPKAGIPAYGFATYVALARMSANKHHLSDVLMGAAIGVAAGRTVTMGVAGARFDLGVAPTQGGAAFTFTRR